jgi:hypothetical protein
LLTEIGKQLLAKSKAEGISVNGSSSSQTQEDKEDVENKNITDTDVKAILQSVACKEGNWSEEFVSSEQKSTQRDSVNLKLAQNFIFENSGLTQQQILAIIKYQNSKEQNSECFVPPDQPSTSAVCSREKALQNVIDVSVFSGVQSRTGVSNTAEASCSTTGVSNTSEASCSRTGVSNTSESSCSITNINSTCDADTVDKCKVDVSNDETVEGNICSTRQTAGIPTSAFSPVGDIQRNSSSNIEQLNSDSDSDSDSDTDFVEVTDVATLPVHRTAENTLELLIQKDKICEIEDDIFADVFSTQTSKQILGTNTNPQDFASKSLSSSSFLRATESNTGNEFKLTNSKVVESIVIQDDCRRKDIEADTDVSKSCGIEPDQKDESPQVAQVTTTEELQKLQVQALSS